MARHAHGCVKRPDGKIVDATQRPLRALERPMSAVLPNSGADIPGAWVLMQDVTRIASPAHAWLGLPKE